MLPTVLNSLLVGSVPFSWYDPVKTIVYKLFMTKIIMQLIFKLVWSFEEIVLKLNSHESVSAGSQAFLFSVDSFVVEAMGCCFCANSGHMIKKNTFPCAWCFSCTLKV